MTKIALPCDTCGGKCCGPVPLSKKEYKTIRKIYGIPRGAKHDLVSETLHLLTINGMCAFLKDGRCSVYEHRPEVCRKFGEIPQLPCPVVHKGANLEMLKRVDSLLRKGRVCG